MPRPTVSVIIIFLDPGARFLAEAIASVRAQTFDDWELLLVDDGSSDASSELARAAAAAEPDRIRYLEHQGHANRGMSASRNLGVSAARGRYLTFLDADDVYLPDRLLHHVGILDAHPEAALVFGRHQLWFSWQGATLQADRPVRLGFVPERVYAPPAVQVRLLQSAGRYNPGICTLTVRRDAALAVGAFEPEFRGCYEDQVFMSKIFLAYPVFVTERVDSLYRQHDASFTATAAESGEYRAGLPHPTRERYLRWLEAHIEATGKSDPELRQALQRELWPYDKRWQYNLAALPWHRLRFELKRLKRRVLRRLASSLASTAGQ
ncbi:MAG: glycosyltransferase family A protein [Geminicoccaceae bacterium]